MVDIVKLQAANEKRWAVAKPTRNFVSVARSLVAAKDRYLAVTSRTGVPWYFIAIVHEREASQSWTGSLAQGDPWDRVSVHVPAGRGPFASWADAAVDALARCPPYAAHNSDWSIGALLTLFEEYNGLGYAARGLPSPYVWSGTDQYVKGKFTGDHEFNPNVVDQQLGCAGLLMAMVKLDRSIVVGDPVIIMPTSPPLAPEIPAAPISHPAPGLIAQLLAALLSLFKRK